MSCGRYPFERKGDDKDPHKFQKILERIQRVGAFLRFCVQGMDALQAGIMQLAAQVYRHSSTGLQGPPAQCAGSMRGAAQ